MDLVTIEYSLHFRGEYHIGTGRGSPGGIDDVCERDRNDHLFISRRTIKGVLRTAARQLCRWYPARFPICEGEYRPRKREEGEQSPSSYTSLCLVNGPDRPCAICSIFGSPASPARFHFHDARYPEPVARTLEDIERAPIEWFSKQVKRAQFRSRARSARDPELRRAAEDKLFIIEEAFPLEGVFTGRVDEIHKSFRGVDGKVHELTRDERERDLVVLLTALRLVTEIGGGRRKGAGACRFEPVKITGLEEAENWFDYIQRYFQREDNRPQEAHP